MLFPLASVGFHVPPGNGFPSIASNKFIVLFEQTSIKVSLG